MFRTAIRSPRIRGLDSLILRTRIVRSFLSPRPVVNGYELPELASRHSSPALAEQVSVAPPTVSQTLSQPQTLPPIDQVQQPVSPASFVVQPAVDALVLAEPEKMPTPESIPAQSAAPATDSARPSGTVSVSKVTIPPNAWNVLPETCIARMLEFTSMQAERRQSFPEAALELVNRDVERLTLANLMELAMINSREYQTRKEILFRAALAVTRLRYQFELNPTPFQQWLGGQLSTFSRRRNHGKTRWEFRRSLVSSRRWRRAESFLRGSPTVLSLHSTVRRVSRAILVRT